MVTRRRLLKTGSLIGASALITLSTPELMLAAERLAASARRSPDFRGTRLVAILSGGAAADQLGVRSGRGIAPGGPQAIAAMRDGRLAILDTLNGRVLYLTNGRPSGVEALPGALYPLDMDVLDSGLVVFDPSATALFAVGGGRVRTRTLPRSDLNAVSRIMGFANTTVLVEEDSTSFDSGSHRSTRSSGYPDALGGRLTIAYESGDVPRRRRAQIRQGDGTTFDIVTTHALGSVVALGRDDAGRSYFQVSELVPSEGGLDVDLTLRRFLPDGLAAGVARAPVRGRESHPRRAACFAPNGDAFALFPEASQVRILQLDWAVTIAPLAPLVSLIQLPKLTANAALLIANCRTTAIDIGKQYAHVTHNGGSWIATAANLDHAGYQQRTGVAVTKPAFLVGPGTYYELPYCWGGMHLPQGFINEMNAGKLAGNANTTGNFKLDTSSVDCSGMIQQCWGVGDGVKQDDTMLTNWVTESNRWDVGATLSPGDMWRLPGEHARMHRAYPGDGTGEWMIESTMDWGNKCYNTFRPWSDYVNYYWNKGNFQC